MIATAAVAAMQTGKLSVYVADEVIDDATIASVKDSTPGAIVLADLLEPLYETSMPTREAAHMLGRVKSELESMVERGARVVVLCRRRPDDLGTRAHFLASLCASADRVHFLKST
jgi:hypothetical protein